MDAMVGGVMEDPCESRCANDKPTYSINRKLRFCENLMGRSCYSCLQKTKPFDCTYRGTLLPMKNIEDYNPQNPSTVCNCYKEHGASSSVHYQSPSGCSPPAGQADKYFCA